MVQKCIDPITGRDITGEHIHQRLIELEKIAVDIVNKAIQEFKKNSDKNHSIYEKYYWELHQELGVGSIGPATAAAGPLMYSKMDELAEKLGIPEEKRIS
jgi:hypothetical protein